MTPTIRNLTSLSRTLILFLLLFVVAVAVVFTRAKVSRADPAAPAERYVRPEPGSAALSATTFVVNTTNDTLLAGACAAATPGQCSLREAIVEANANSGADTIDASGVTGTINLAGVLPDISEDVTINGPGAALLNVRRDTGGNYRIFNVTTAGTVTFSGLTISNGHVEFPGNGGGIFNLSGTVNVIDSTVRENSGSNGEGGGIYNDSGTLNVTNSTLSGNHMDNGLGAGGIFNRAGTVSVTNSNITGNYCTGQCGIGGILNDGGTLTVTNSTLTGNDGGSNGGALGNAGTMVVSNSTLNANSASEGGGISNVGTATIINTTLSGNDSNFRGGGIWESRRHLKRRQQHVKRQLCGRCRRRDL